MMPPFSPSDPSSDGFDMCLAFDEELIVDGSVVLMELSLLLT